MTQEAAALDAAAPPAALVTRTTLTRALLTCGAVAGPLFLGVAVIQMLFRDGFELSRHPISALSLVDLGWIQISSFVLSGLLTIAFAIGVRRAEHPGRGGTWGPLLLGAYGVGLIAAGLFVTDPACGYPAGAPAGMPNQLSWHAVMHGMAFRMAFSSLIAACLVFVRRFAALARWGWAAHCAATGVAALALSAWPSQDGASVRYAVAAVVVWAWTTAIAVRLLADVADARGSTAIKRDQVPITTERRTGDRG